MNNGNDNNQWADIERPWGNGTTRVETVPEERWGHWLTQLEQTKERVQAGTTKKELLTIANNSVITMPRGLVERSFRLLMQCITVDGKVEEATLPRMDVMKKWIIIAIDQLKTEVTVQLADKQIARAEEEQHWATKREKETKLRNEVLMQPTEEFFVGIATAAAQAAIAASGGKSSKPTRKTKELPSFDGSPDKVNDFIITMMTVEGDSEEARVENIKNLLPGMLEGSASAWLPIARNLDTLQDLCDSVLMEYSGKSTLEHKEDFSSIKRKKTETCWDFWARCKNTRTAINNASREGQIAEGTMTRAFRRGLGQGYESLNNALFSRSAKTMSEVVEVMNEWATCAQENGVDPHGMYAISQPGPASVPTTDATLLTAITKLTHALQQQGPVGNQGNIQRRGSWIDNPPYNHRFANVECHACHRRGHLKAHHHRQAARGNDKECRRCGEKGHLSPTCPATMDKVRVYQGNKEVTVAQPVNSEAQLLRDQLAALQKQMQILQSRGVAVVTPDEESGTDNGYQTSDFREARPSQ